MTPDEFRAALFALYGPHTAANAAKDMGVSKRSVERWLSGKHKPPLWAIRSVEKTKELTAVDGAVAAMAGFR